MITRPSTSMLQFFWRRKSRAPPTLNVISGAHSVRYEGMAEIPPKLVSLRAPETKRSVFFAFRFVSLSILARDSA